MSPRVKHPLVVVGDAPPLPAAVARADDPPTTIRRPRHSVSAIDRQLMRKDFGAFVERFWPRLDPHPLTPNIATAALVAHLQAVGDGKITRLAIALPPGLGKTTMGVLFAAWLWARNPAHRTIYASYVHDVASNATAKVRRLVEHVDYRACYPEVVLRADQNRLDDIGTTAGGRLFAAGVGGALTSVRADTAIVDDSLNAVDAFSRAARDRANTWFENGLLTRLDGDHASVVAIQQRLAASDLIGYLEERDDYEMLILPAEFDPARRCVTSIWTDPRTEDGELLAPTILSAAKLDEHKRASSALYMTQYQQSPVDALGGLLRREHWSWWKPDGTSTRRKRPTGSSDDPAVPRPPNFERIVVSVDTAFKGKETSDYFVAIVAGVVGAHRFLLEMVRRKMNYGPAKQTIREIAKRYPGCTILVEDSASGTGIVSELGGEVPNLIAVPTGGRAKEERVQFASPAVEARQVFLPEGAAWVDAFVVECAAFPRSDNDDVPDALAQLLNYLNAPPVDKDLADRRRTFARNIAVNNSTKFADPEERALRTEFALARYDARQRKQTPPTWDAWLASRAPATEDSEDDGDDDCEDDEPAHPWTVTAEVQAERDAEAQRLRYGEMRAAFARAFGAGPRDLNTELSSMYGPRRGRF